MQKVEKKWWIVTGRVEGDWEDIGEVFHCKTECEAEEYFKDSMRAGSGKKHATIYINTIAYSETQISIV